MTEYEVKIIFESNAVITLNMNELSWAFFKSNLALISSVKRVEIKDVNSVVWSVLSKPELEMTHV